MKTLIILSLITALLLWYALQGRDWLKKKGAVKFFAWVEPIEILLFKKSQTILAGRTLQGLGVALTALQQIDGIDITPILPIIPEEYRTFATTAVGCLPMIISAIGWMMEKLRYTNTKPVGLVALPDKLVAENPVLREAVAMADATKVEAVAVAAVAVAEAKAA
jgi:hypothetical protein